VVGPKAVKVAARKSASQFDFDPRIKAMHDAETKAHGLGHELGPWQESSDGGIQAWCHGCDKDAKIGTNNGEHYTVGPTVYHPCDNSGAGKDEHASDIARMHMDNDYDNYHDIQGLVNHSSGPEETSGVLKSYLNTLPLHHPMHQELMDHGYSADDVDTTRGRRICTRSGD
jgi:hypothetical protein